MTTRYIAKCKKCNAHTSTLASNVNRANADMGALFRDDVGESGIIGALVMRCRSCNRARAARAVIGKVSDRHVCGARCMASTGPSCECSCGGRNHGASYSA